MRYVGSDVYFTAQGLVNTTLVVGGRFFPIPNEAYVSITLCVVSASNTNFMFGPSIDLNLLEI